MSLGTAEPDAETVRAALGILLHGAADEQRDNMAGFLLGELERLYVAGGRIPPTWIGRLRLEFRHGKQVIG